MRALKSLLIACSLVMVSSFAFASDVIGLIEPTAVMTSHPSFQAIQKKVTAVVQAKLDEAQKAVSAAKTDEEKNKIMMTKRQEAAVEEQKLMAPLFKDLDLAIQNVAKAKKVTVVLDKSIALFGGIDLTTDVIQELKRIATAK